MDIDLKNLLNTISGADISSKQKWLNELIKSERTCRSLLYQGTQTFLLKEFHLDSFITCVNKNVVSKLKNSLPDSAKFAGMRYADVQLSHEGLHENDFYSERYFLKHELLFDFEFQLTNNKRDKSTLIIEFKSEFPDVHVKNFVETTHGIHSVSVLYRNEHDLFATTYLDKSIVLDFLKIENIKFYFGRRHRKIKDAHEFYYEENRKRSRNHDYTENDYYCDRCQESPCACSDPDPG
jgi:hypothetical protein